MLREAYHPGNRPTYFEEKIEVVGCSDTFNDSFENAHQPCSTFTTGNAFAAGLVRVELRQRQCRRRNVGGGIHHHDRARTKH